MKTIKITFVFLLLFKTFLYGQKIDIFNEKEKILILNVKKENLIKTLDSLEIKNKKPFYIQRFKNRKLYRCKIVKNKLEKFLI